MFSGCIYVHGTGRVQVVENKIKKEQYHHVLEHRLLPQARDWFGNDPWIYQHDHAPVHTAKLCAEYLQHPRVMVLDWPGNFPDLKESVNKKGVYSRSDVIKEVLNIWARSDELLQICNRLTESMRRRVKECIAKKGGNISY